MRTNDDQRRSLKKKSPLVETNKRGFFCRWLSSVVIGRRWSWLVVIGRRWAFEFDRKTFQKLFKKKLFKKRPRSLEQSGSIIRGAAGSRTLVQSS